MSEVSSWQLTMKTQRCQAAWWLSLSCASASAGAFFSSRLRRLQEHLGDALSLAGRPRSVGSATEALRYPATPPPSPFLAHTTAGTGHMFSTCLTRDVTSARPCRETCENARPRAAAQSNPERRCGDKKQIFFIFFFLSFCSCC